MAHTVKAVADLAGISIRTLHHYDEIGLLKPAELSAAGYRLYSQQDLERLQQVLFFRELGLSLHEIQAILDSPGFDRKQALLDHRKLLQERQRRLERLIRSVDQTLEAMKRGTTMDEKAMFDGFDPSQYEEEARQRWGHSKEFQQSVERTKRYTKGDWEGIQQEIGQISQGIAALMERSPEDPEVQGWVGKWHQVINDRFYACSSEVFRGLADLYVQDERFTAVFEKTRPGMAEFMRQAMHAYCDKLESK